MLLDTTSQGASAPTTKGESRMENGRKIAPRPMRKTSQARVVYEAIDTLGGQAIKRYCTHRSNLFGSITVKIGHLVTWPILAI